ncbi:S8 family serine peptidase [Candidatus Woesearchaeota archaeon]|nr:S8 family serine peptidase [Candidatus Woesearchaeota archaeon]MCF8013833.1 S8 family serine peptidase [Candidatus Woesearchaeota archaeon]
MKNYWLFWVLVVLVLVSGCNFVADCGNGFCEGSESFNSCPQDCDEPVECVLNSDCDDGEDYTFDYCSDDRCFHDSYDCLVDDDCDDGDSLTSNSCVEHVCEYVPVMDCTDYDGDDIYNASKVIFNGKEYFDSCIDEYNLVEYLCEEGVVYNTTVDCGDFYNICHEGACVNSHDVCVEDGDKNLFIKNVDDLSVEEEFIEPIPYSGYVKIHSLSIAGESQFIAIDGIDNKVLAKSEKISGGLLSMANENKNSYIVEFDQEPLVSVYARYVDRFGNDELNNLLTGNAASSDGVKAAYVSEISSAKKLINKNKDSVVSMMVDNGVIKNSNDIKNSYSVVFSGISVDLSEDEMNDVKSLSGVKSVYPDSEVHAILDVSVPLIGANNVWNNYVDMQGNKLTGKGVNVAIIDTGVDYTHSDLGGCIGATCKVKGGYDFINYDYDPIDDNGHGTHVAATVAGDGVLKGVAPDANIYAYKVLSSEGSGSTSGVIDAIERSMDPNQDGDLSDHMNVISLSLGHDGGDPSTDASAIAIDNVVSAGVVAVIAAGNSGPSYSTVGCPGCADNALTVAASDDNDALAYFSSRGPTQGFTLKPDISAPGVNICAAQSSNEPWNDRLCIDEDHVSISGTSMATPHVSGVVALLLQKYPDLKPDEVKAILMQNSEKIKGNLLEVGSGRVDAINSVNFDYFFTPSLLDFNNADSSGLSGFFHNYEGDSAFFSVSHSEDYFFDGFVDEFDQKFSFSKNCFEVSDLDELIISLDSSSLNYGFYFGNIVFNEVSSCSSNGFVVNSFSVPYEFKKVKKLNVTIIPKNLGFDNSFKDGYLEIYSSGNKWLYSDSFYLDYNISSFEIELLSDSDLKILYFGSDGNFLPDRWASLTDFIYTDFVSKDSDEIIIDENDMVKVDSNLDELAFERGFKTLFEEGIYFVFDIYKEYNGKKYYRSFGSGKSGGKCSYLFKDSALYLKDSFIKDVYYSRLYSEHETYFLDSESGFINLHGLVDDDYKLFLDADSIAEKDLVFDDSFAIEPHGLVLAVVNFYEHYSGFITAGVSTSNMIEYDELPVTKKFYTNIDDHLNFWFLSRVFPNFESDLSYWYFFTDIVFQDSWFGFAGSKEFGVLGDSVEFYKDPYFALQDSYWVDAVIPKFVPSNFDDSVKNSIYGVYDIDPDWYAYDLYHSKIIKPDGSVVEGDFSFVLRCDGRGYSSIDHVCDEGTYKIEWDTSKASKLGTKIWEVCRRDGYWDISGPC